MRRFLTVTGLLVLLAAALSGAIFYFALFTQRGLRFIVDHLPQRFGAVEVRIEGASGTLAFGVHARRVVIDQRRVHLEFDGVHTRVLLPPLYWRTLDTPDTSVDNALVEIRRSHLPPRPHPHFLPWWLVIRIQHAHIGHAEVVLPDGKRLQGTDIDGSARLAHRDMRFYRVALTMGTVRYSAAGALHAARPLRLSAAGRILWRAPHQPAWRVEASFAGNLNRLTLGAKVLEPFQADFRGLALDLPRAWHWRGEARVRNVDLRTWHRGAALGRIDAQLALSGDAKGFKAGGTADPTGLHAGRFHIELDGDYSNRVLTARRLAITHLASGAHLAASGSVRLATRGPRLDLRGRWRDVRWPLTGTAAFHSPAGAFTLTGGGPVDVTATGVAQIGAFQPVPTRIAATLDSRGLTVTGATLEALGGQVQARGELGWQPPRPWSLHARAVGIDPGKLRPMLRGALDLVLSASGEGFGASAPLTVRLESLRGHLRGLPASGSGALSHSGRVWIFQQVRASLGGVHLALDGRIDRRQAHARFSVGGDLRLLAAADQGRVEAAGTIGGPLDAPDIRAWATGKGVRMGSLELASAEAKVDFDPTSRRRSAVTVRLRDLRFHRRLLHDLDFILDGAASDLTAHLTAHAPGLSVRGSARGSFDAGVFAGQVTSLAVSGAQALNLHLLKPSALTLSPAHSELDDLCLAGTPGGLCTGASWTPEAWAVTLSASALPLATLTAGLTPAVEYQGMISAQARLAGGGGAPAQGTLRTTLADAVLSRRLVSGRIERTTIGSGLLTVTALPGTIQAHASLTSGAIGTFDATLEARRGAPDWRDMPIQGTAQAQTSKLQLVSIYLPGIDDVSGHLIANASIAGTVADPRLTGEVSVSNGKADLYQSNLRLRDAALTARLVDGGLVFDGSARVGRGVARASGRMNWRGALPYGQLHLEGDDLRVVDTPEARIDASPDLDFKVAAHRIDVTGTVFVPHAAIHPKDLTGAVRTSSDQVIVGQESSNPEHRYQVMSVISLGLGNDVNIDTMGLTGQLTGALTVRSGYGYGTHATGDLFMERGQYAAYARKLDIQYGRLFFRGGLLDNPGIEIRAVKSYPDVTAGINVSGTLKQPQVSFFSNPSLSQSQIMSLIFSGGGGALQALSTGTAQSQQNTAAGELLAQGGALLAQQLGSRIGLPEFTLQTDLNDVTSLVLGKYLSPRLYVSYGVGLTEQLNEIRLRYSISEHWTIRVLAGQGKGAAQSKSGQIGGADLVFSVVK